MPSRTQYLSDIDRSHVWHPFTQMQDYVSSNPIIIERGEGVYLYDTDGNRYLDAFSSVWCNVHGHRVPAIDEAIHEQLDQIGHSTLLGLGNVPSIELASKLVNITPEGLNHVFYSDSGATAVEVAIKIAYQYWQQREDPRPQKTKFLHIASSYHGDTVGTVSVGGIDLFHKAYGPLLFETLAVPAPHPYRCSFCSEAIECNQGCTQALEETLERHGDTIAAFVVEPLVQAAGGMLVHPPGYLAKAAELCRDHEVLLIVDEVATGFGRTGRMFACDHEDVSPDLLCLGKGMTGGYLPVAATLASSPVYEAFLGDYEEQKTFFHGHTFTGNPIGCAAALASIDLMFESNLLDEVQSRIDHTAARLKELADHPYVGDVRQLGLIAAIELVANKASRRPYDWKSRIGVQICDIARERGVLMRPLGNTIVLMPPLVISTEQIDEALDVTFDAIDQVVGAA
ncbi:MAG: adenosylmethionine--8-amino-7-oxononanoate transaminase [Gemmatimonadetes bacterium]|nr:adenosylmethionine--8-amino-7-oxononanoate transaminase [Gemmatimonadota bacterium]